MRNLKLIIENYLLEQEEEEPAAEDLPQEEEGDSEEPADDSAGGSDDAKADEEEKEKKAKDIVSDVARIAQKSVAKAVEKIKNSLEYEKPDFEIDISAVPQLVDIFGKESIKKVDAENLSKNADNRIARSQEIMKSRGDLPGGFG
jgi:hypothetical protein